MNPFQPGKSTSEFLMTAVGTILSGVVALVTVLHPGFKMNPDTQRWIVSVLAGGISLMVSLYTSSRAKVKTAAIATGTYAQSYQPIGQFGATLTGAANPADSQFNIGQVEPSDLAGGGQVTMTGLTTQSIPKS